MTDLPRNALAATLFSEILINEQLIRNRLGRVMPKGMEISHFAVLSHLARIGEERSPAQLAGTFHVTRGAMTNTLNKLEWAGYVHIRPDWEDARRKMITISPAGRQACEAAMSAIAPFITEVIKELGEGRIKATLPVLRELRSKIHSDD